MTTDDQHQRVSELLGAFVLHAVEPDEAAVVEQHLAICQRCQREVDQLREVAAAIGNAAERPPEALWERIAAELGEHGDHVVPEGLVEQTAGAASAAPDLASVLELASRSGRSTRRSTPSSRRTSTGGTARSRRRRAWVVAGGAAAAACVALAALFGIDWSNANGRVSQLQQALARQGTTAAVDAALASPGHRVVELTSAKGAGVAELVVRPDGAGYVVRSSMRALPANETYQLWAQIAGNPISLGLLGSRPALGDAFSLGSSVGAARELLVTVEPSGGVVAPTGSPIAKAVLR